MAGRSQARPLVGRDAERAALDALLDRAASGRGGALVVAGARGAGTSALLRQARDAGGARGFRVGTAVGLEFARGLAFGGLSGVLAPFTYALDGLAPAQQRALHQALGLADGPAPPLLAFAATRDLLAAAVSSDRPALLVIDDAQWLDEATLHALVFAAHRGAGTPVAMVFGRAGDVPCVLDRAGLPRLDLHGLPRSAAVELLAGEGVVPAVARRCWASADGNARALIEGARGLTVAQRTGRARLPPVLPAAERSLAPYRRRLQRLRPTVREALGLASLVDGDEALVAFAAIAAGGGAGLPTLDDLGRAERDGLVTVGERRLRWSHPLVRTAAYEALGPERRRTFRRLLDEAVARGPSPSGLTLSAELTRAEMRVARVVAAGATNREAARRLYVSAKTVDYHLQNIYRKLGVHSRTQLAGVVWATGATRPGP